MYLHEYLIFNLDYWQLKCEIINKVSDIIVYLFQGLGGKSTLHATMQNLVRVLGIRPDLPGPSCAPDKMNSLTLLYMDETGKVILSIYPNMIVESCKCQ